MQPDPKFVYLVVFSDGGNQQRQFHFVATSIADANEQAEECIEASGDLSFHIATVHRTSVLMTPELARQSANQTEADSPLQSQIQLAN